MHMEEKKIVYFTEPGEKNTVHTLNLAKQRADELGIKDIIIATTRGGTAREAIKIFDAKEYNVIFVTHMAGFRGIGMQEFPDDLKKELISKGYKVLTCMHALSGVERAYRKKYGYLGPAEIMAITLRLFGEGTKVCVEIVLMAADAGLISMENDVIAIAGTGIGADTAFVIKPAHTSNVFDLTVREIICKPRKR